MAQEIWGEFKQVLHFQIAIDHKEKVADASSKFGDPVDYVLFGWREGPRP